MYLSVFVHGVVYNIGNASLYTDQHTDCMLQFGGLDSGASLCDALGEGGNSFQAKMQWRCSPSRLDRCQCHKMWQVVSYPNSDWYWIQYLSGYNFVSYKPTSSISVLLKKYQVFRFNMCKVSVRNSRKKIGKTLICIALLIKHCSQVAAKSQGPEAVAAAGSPLYYVRPRWCQCFDDYELNGAASSWPGKLQGACWSLPISKGQCLWQLNHSESKVRKRNACVICCWRKAVKAGL